MVHQIQSVPGEPPNRQIQNYRTHRQRRWWYVRSSGNRSAPRTFIGCAVYLCGIMPAPTLVSADLSGLSTDRFRQQVIGRSWPELPVCGWCQHRTLEMPYPSRLAGYGDDGRKRASGEKTSLALRMASSGTFKRQLYPWNPQWSLESPPLRLPLSA